MEIALVDIPDRSAAAVLHVGPYDHIGAAFDRLGDWVRVNATRVAGPPLALYLNDPQTTPPGELRSYAAVPIVPGAPDDRSEVIERIPLAGGRYAVAAHHGGYSGLGRAWAEFVAAVAADGLDPDMARPCFEVYANEPGTVPDEELITELYQPIA